jgi:Tol biopolymer transport system component
VPVDRGRGRRTLTLAVVLGLLAATSASAGQSPIRRVSVGSRERQGNGNSLGPVLSADGRFVAFRSRASNLVRDDGNRAQDVFVRDRRTGRTTRVSLAEDGSEGNEDSGGAAISADGRVVAFWSSASNLVADDTNDRRDMFVRDRAEGTTTLVSISSAGAHANGPSRQPALSANGRFVAFRSDASNLVSDDTNGTGDIFVHDLLSDETTRVSIRSRGGQANGRSRDPSLNADGHFVAFRSDASNLVPRDTNGAGDIFVHDRRSGATTRASVGAGGRQAGGCGVTGCGCDPVLSADGQLVSFWSSASNLVPDDTNEDWDVFVHDVRSGLTTRVSVGPNGRQGDGLSGEPWLSATGRFVAFASNAPLTAGDSNRQWDVFLHDRRTGVTTGITIDDVHGNGLSTDPVVSGDGRFVAFYSFSSNLVDRDTNRAADIFVRRR